MSNYAKRDRLFDFERPGQEGGAILAGGIRALGAKQSRKLLP